MNTEYGVIMIDHYQNPVMPSLHASMSEIVSNCGGIGMWCATVIGVDRYPHADLELVHGIRTAMPCFHVLSGTWLDIPDMAAWTSGLPRY